MLQHFKVLTALFLHIQLTFQKLMLLRRWVWIGKTI